MKMHDAVALGPIYAMARPARIVTPVKQQVSAFQKPEPLDRWNAGIHAKSDENPNTVTIYDVIGEDPWTGGGVTVNRIDAALRKIGAENPIEVHLNSPGGDMFEGIAIYNRLREHKGEITVKIMGLAASAASIIAMAGDRVEIGAASFLMIHDCWVMAIGNRHDMAETAAFLAPFDAAMASVYAERTGIPVADIATMMDNETWINGADAVERGFADALLAADEIEEDDAKAEAGRGLNALRAAEIALCKAGHSRTDARALLKEIKGTPGAANDPTPGAGETDAMAALIAAMKA